MTHVFSDVESLSAAVGSELGVSGWRTVDQQLVDDFAAVTGDRQWIHTDPARAADGPFGATVAHGLLSLSLLPALATEAYRIDGVTSRVNYGYENVRFPAAVRVGSRVRNRVELVSVEPAPAGTRLTTRHVLEVDGQSKPGCVAVAITLIPAEPEA
ncbi:MaoC family dehydratase [Salinibacterium sp. ZJ454]|uniref:MaoC family dehydratase n=1 Tax=Salinibacterium sp. ZJ454 TaxID=2708339 RepID=UPI00142072FC|nr:MaoC family dehydratase [Salinibacterium sp. ZJ454]